MKKSLSFILLLSILLSVLCSGQSQHFKYRRPIAGVKDQWHSILLPDDIFGKTKSDFGDIRIYGISNLRDSIEVPYIMDISVKKAEPKIIPFTLINQSSKQTDHFFTFELRSLKSINSITLDFADGNYDWRIQLEGSQDQKDWYSILSDYRILSIKNDQTDYQFNKLVFQESKYMYYRMIVKNKTRPVLKSAAVYEMIDENKVLKQYDLENQSIINDKINKKTIIDVTIKNYSPVSNVAVFVKDRTDYYRPFTVKYLSDSVHFEKGWKYKFALLTSGMLNSMEKNTFECTPAVFKKMSIVIENNDNQPLKIDSVLVYGPIYSLIARFDRQDIPYYLYYGNQSIGSPQYDITFFKTPQSITPVTPDTEEILLSDKSSGVTPLFQNKIWLWAILLLVILLLGWFGFKMISNTN